MIVGRELIVDVTKRLPQGAVSRAWGWLARRRRPRLGVLALQRAFVAATGIDMTEAEGSVDDFACLQDLFVRRLRPGMRSIDPDPAVVVCPVDGTVGACGTVHDGMLTQIKGRTYSLERLLGSAAEAAHFAGGVYATFYLAPRDCHRIHAPVSGQVCDATAIPGHLLPVFAAALERVDELFARNERLITYIDSADAGRVALVKVGATLVGRISVSYDATLRTNDAAQGQRTVHYDPPRLLQKGADLGAFELGSTVVLLGQAGRLSLDEMAPGLTVRLGQRIGSLVPRRAQRRARGSGRREGAPRAAPRGRSRRPRSDSEKKKDE